MPVVRIVAVLSGLTLALLGSCGARSGISTEASTDSRDTPSSEGACKERRQTGSGIEAHIQYQGPVPAVKRGHTSWRPGLLLVVTDDGVSVAGSSKSLKLTLTQEYRMQDYFALKEYLSGLALWPQKGSVVYLAASPDTQVSRLLVARDLVYEVQPRLVVALSQKADLASNCASQGDSVPRRGWLHLTYADDSIEHVSPSVTVADLAAALSRRPLELPGASCFEYGSRERMRAISPPAWLSGEYYTKPCGSIGTNVPDLQDQSKGRTPQGPFVVTTEGPLSISMDYSVQVRLGGTDGPGFCVTQFLEPLRNHRGSFTEFTRRVGPLVKWVQDVDGDGSDEFTFYTRTFVDDNNSMLTVTAYDLSGDRLIIDLKATKTLREQLAIAYEEVARKHGDNAIPGPDYTVAASYLRDDICISGAGR